MTSQKTIRRKEIIGAILAEVRRQLGMVKKILKDDEGVITHTMPGYQIKERGAPHCGAPITRKNSKRISLFNQHVEVGN